MTLNKPLLSRTDFAALCLLAAASLSLAALAYSFGGVDFGVYYAAGRLFWKGGNPYDYSQLAGEIVSSTGELNNPYYYAPWFTWGISILALLPFPIARAVWAILNFVFWFWALFNISKLTAWNATGWKRWGAYLFATILFAWSTWGSEQVGILILLLFAAALEAHENGKWPAMGMYMALLLFKPNITAFPILFLAAWLVLRRNWKPVIWMGSALLVMTIVSLVVSPGWYLALLQPDKLTGLSYTLNESGEVQIPRYSSTLLDWLAAYGIAGSPAYVIYAIVVVCGLAAAAWLAFREKSVVRLTAYLLLANFAVIPYALFYDYACLTLTLFYLNFEMTREALSVWTRRLMNGLVFASLFVGGNISHRYWIVIILAAFSLYRWMNVWRGGRFDGTVTSS